MKCLLITIYTALAVAGVFASSSIDDDTYLALSSKEKYRFKLQKKLEWSREVGFATVCPRQLSPENIEFGNEQYEQLHDCANATFDKFFDKFDDNINFDDIKMFGDAVRLVAPPACEVFDHFFKCVGSFSSALDLCLEDDEKIFKNKFLAIVPLIQQTVCLRNGDLIAELTELEHSMNCIEGALFQMRHINVIDLSKSEATELFNDKEVCQRFHDVVNQFYSYVGQCSLLVLEKVKDMLGFFCDHTQCERYVPELKCY